ncbi:MAG: hypothetical protein JSU73_06165 [candidate division WOR-3 bacterium]|nr:MAG: hypothetical protein JSU73_06165 [candidate division WOR-3 bacterium]
MRTWLLTLLAACVSTAAAIGIHSVYPAEILAPKSTVDSGLTLAPLLVVSNDAGMTAESVLVHFTIDNETVAVIYHDSLMVTLPAQASDTLQFADWTPVGRDSMTAIAWTRWAGDSAPDDDTLSQRFFVRVATLGIRSLWPWTDTIDPGWYYPQCEVWNYGNQIATFRLSFSFSGPSPYLDTVWVRNLLPGGSRTVTPETPWRAFRPGMHIYTLACSLAGEMRPDSTVFVCTVWVRGGLHHDVGVAEIRTPSGVMDTTAFQPKARVRNFADSSESFWTYFWIDDTTTDALVYRDSQYVHLDSGQQSLLTFTETQLTVEGPYLASCSAHLAGDHNWSNNARHECFRVGIGAEHNVDIVAVLIPKTAPLDTIITPCFIVLNTGQWTETFTAGFHMEGRSPESTEVADLAVGVSESLYFMPWQARPPGWHRYSAWVRLLQGSGDTLHDSIYVLAPGVAEREVAGMAETAVMPTIISRAQGRLRLLPPADRSQLTATLHDPAGRAVLHLQPGDNDVSYLSPGVYFVRRKGPRIQGSEGPRRIVVTD